MQIFLDEECTQYATGEVDEVYVRINTPWDTINSGWSVGLPDEPGTCFDAISPATETPDDSYMFIIWKLFWSLPDGPYTQGQVVPAKVLTSGEIVDVTGYQTIFTKP